jgi:hypothetical protein
MASFETFRSHTVLLIHIEHYYRLRSTSLLGTLSSIIETRQLPTPASSWFASTICGEWPLLRPFALTQPFYIYTESYIQWSLWINVFSIALWRPRSDPKNKDEHFWAIYSSLEILRSLKSNRLLQTIYPRELSPSLKQAMNSFDSLRAIPDPQCRWCLSPGTSLQIIITSLLRHFTSFRYSLLVTHNKYLALLNVLSYLFINFSFL